MCLAIYYKFKMGSPLRYFLYGIVTITSLLSFVYYMTNYTKWDLFGYSLGFWVLVGSIIYTSYMFIHKLVKPAAQVNISESSMTNKSFIVDIYSKYLFSFAFGLFIFYMVFLFRNNFDIRHIYPSDTYLLNELYVNIFLPVFCMIDTLITHRSRRISMFFDYFVLFVITFLHCLYKCFVRAIWYESAKIVLPTIADYIVIYLVTLNGYHLYDYLVMKNIMSQEKRRLC